jgi:selenide,water dikinase
MLNTLTPPSSDNLLLAFDTSDDAAVYRVSDDMAAVLSVDFFTPIVDDPYEFGRIAGANALSDIYAMGAKPLVALNLLALDSCLGADVAADILRGGADSVAQAGALIVGGHTIDDSEPKYGLSVYGSVHPDKVIKNNGAQPGDRLYLTKPLGTGILSSAYKIGKETRESMDFAIRSMMELNQHAQEAMILAHAHAATDITGFGLVGHLHEMLEASSCSAALIWENIPLFKNVWQYSKEYCRPSRTFSLMEYAEDFIQQGALENDEFDNRMGVLCDPQTSGGLLIALAQEDSAIFEEEFTRLTGKNAWFIGNIEGGTSGNIGFTDRE